MTESTVEPNFYQKQVVEVDVPDGRLKGVYNTRIENLNEQALLLEAPQVGNLYLPLGVGQPFVLRYVEESWAYEAQVAVGARKDNLESPLMLVVRPASVTRRLLRRFVRVETEIETSLCLIKDLKEYGMEQYKNRELTQGAIVDISGGGARIRVPASMETAGKGYAILWFTLPYIHKSFYSMLTRINSVTEESSNKFIIIEFTGLSEAERDDVVQYCHRKQAENV
ncbi:flagellar brake domain-containing protein [bacterium]|nr:flagellar brake domain-containing protein [bacterium]